MASPLAAQALQRLGYHKNESWVTQEDKKDISSTKQPHLVQVLSATTHTPIQGSSHAVGYNLFSDKVSIIIEPYEIQFVLTGIAFKYPDGTHGRIAPRKGLTNKNKITNLAGVIDPDYIGTIIVVMYNFGTLTRAITQHQRIAQIIFEKILHPIFQIG